MARLAFTLCLTFILHALSAQENTREQIKISIIEQLKAFEKQYTVTIHYPAHFPNFQVKPVDSASTLASSLRSLVQPIGLSFIESYDGIYIIRTESISPDVAEFISADKLKSETAHELPKLGAQYGVKTNHKISGLVIDGNSEKPIYGASILAQEIGQWSVTSTSGNFELTLPSGNHSLIVSFAGYDNELKTISLFTDTEADFQLFEASTMMNELIISGKSEVFDNTKVDVVSINTETIKTLPTFLGEVDIIRSLTTLPGVSTLGEGASGFHVRGGTMDQNLVFLDNAPIFNSSHLFGFISAFDADIIRDFSLFKGGIPSRYGGRISSILDIKTKTGSYTERTFTGSVGMLASNIQTSMPLVKDKMSISTGFRFAYPTWLFEFVPADQVKNSSASFYDLNLKVSRKLDEHSALILSGYRSFDRFNFTADTTYQWSTSTLSADYTRAIGGHTLNINGFLSDYSNLVNGSANSFLFDFKTNIRVYGMNGSYNTSLNETTQLEAGVGSSLYKLDLGSLTPSTSQSSINSFDAGIERALESYGYVSIDKKINSSLSFILGLRYSSFINFGSRDVYTYDPLNPKNPGSIIDTTSYKSNKIFNSAGGLEPRFSASYKINEVSSMKIGFNLMRQYIHLISNTTAVSPVDTWKLSDTHIKPQVGWQGSIGYLHQIPLKHIEFSIEGFVKQIDGIIDYKDGAQLLLNKTLETELVSGNGHSYGVEFFFKKTTKRFNGWASYTYSRSLRQISGPFREETLNKGNYFPSNFDKPHDLSVVTSFILSRKMIVSGNFSYSSGRPITLPVSTYYYNGTLITDFSERNQGRIPDYHRLDVSLILKNDLKKRARYSSEWSFSIFNIYGRKNPFSVYFTSVNRRLPQAYQLSILGAAVPAVTYSFKIR